MIMAIILPLQIKMEETISLIINDEEYVVLKIFENRYIMFKVLEGESCEFCETWKLKNCKHPNKYCMHYDQQKSNWFIHQLLHEDADDIPDDFYSKFYSSCNFYPHNLNYAFIRKQNRINI